MLFWIILTLLSICAVLLLLGIAAAFIDDDLSFVISVPSATVGLTCFLAVMFSWSDHASDLAKVEAQHHRIAVYEERVESLEDRLNNAQYPDKPDISLDADTPWATMMQSLDKAETELAKAKDQRAIAIRSIASRKRGPMSGVVTMVGDIDETYYIAP